MRRAEEASRFTPMSNTDFIADTIANYPKQPYAHTLTFEDRGLLFEDCMSYAVPLRSLIPGRLGDLLLVEAHFAYCVEEGNQAIGEMGAEHSASWITSGFDPADAPAYASQELRSARALLAEDYERLDIVTALIEDEFPVFGPTSVYDVLAREADEPF